MRKKLIGKRYFGDTIDITDPCYDRDVWCRKNDVKIKAGEYYCYIWKNTDKYEVCGEQVKDTRVGVIGIYLDGFIPLEKQMIEIGSIGVDAGLAGFFENKPDYSDEEWSKFCDSIKKAMLGLRTVVSSVRLDMAMVVMVFMPIKTQTEIL